MTRVVNFPSDIEKIKREATEWIARIERAELTSVEKTELNAWLATSPAHEKQLTRLVQLWDKMSEIGSSTSEQVQQKPVEEKKKVGYLGYFTYKVAAVLALTIVFPLALYLQNLSAIASTNGQYFTKIGEQKSIMLADGSEILLNTNSIVEVIYSRDKRNIDLSQGEANFDVAPDKSRPFTVKAGKGDVRALGTNFSVRLDGDLVNVLVSHGTVRVRAQEKIDAVYPAGQTERRGRNEVIVGAGNNVIFDDVQVESVAQESEQVLAKKLYWRKGYLAFDDELLSDVVAELSRYTSLNIIIADEAIQSMRVGGFYPINNLETVFTTLEINLGLKVEKVSGNYYITNPHT
jgi:transmembrane sensor